MREITDKLKRILKLAEENPTLRVIAWVNNEVMFDEFHSYYEASFGKSYIEEFYQNGEQMYLGEDQIIDELFCSEVETPSDEEIERIMQEKRESGEIQKAIFVDIN